MHWKKMLWTIAALAIVGPVSQARADMILAANSYTGSTLPVYDITGGTPVSYATLNAGGWIGPLGTPDNVHLYAVTNAFNGSLWDITGGGDFTGATPFAGNLFPDGVSFPEGLAFDASGNAYITNSETVLQQKIAVVSSDGTVSYLGDTLTFNNARGLVVQGNTLYIAEGGTGSVLAYDLISNTFSTFASGFTASSSHIAAELALDPRGHLLALWSAGSGYGLFDVTAGGDFTGQAPLVTAPFGIDVNQIAVDSQNNVYAAGNGSGIAYVSQFDGSSFSPFTSFASGLGDTESIVVLQQGPATPSNPEPSSLVLGLIGLGVSLGYAQRRAARRAKG